MDYSWRCFLGDEAGIKNRQSNNALIGSLLSFATYSR